jgi:hypothetical protein
MPSWLSNEEVGVKLAVNVVAVINHQMLYEKIVEDVKRTAHLSYYSKHWH